MTRPATTSSAESSEVTFQIEGMDCPDELEVIERRLRRLRGIGNLYPNYVTRTLRVEFNSGQTQTETIAAAIREVGFSAHREGETRPPVPWRQRHARTILLATATGFLAAAGGLHAANPYLGQTISFPLLLSLLACSTAAGGYHVALTGFKALRRGIPDMNLLMTVAAVGAFALAIFYRELPFEAATVMCLFSAALALERLSLDRARGAIHALMEVAPAQALRMRDDGRTEAIPAAAIQEGDRLLVRPGDKIPADAVVLEGQSSVNESPVTGESVPVEKQAGDAVFAGSLNEEGSLVLRATRSAQESTLAKIIHLVEQAQSTRAPTQQLVDRFARWYTPAVIVLALWVATLPPLAGRWGIVNLNGSWDYWIYRGLVLLVIACPCALVISTPVTIVCGLTRAARQGLLIKGGAHLENAGRLRAIVFDKTGTLTAGHMQVEHVIAAHGHAPDEVLALAAAVEQASEHPLARAIVRAAQERGLPLARMSDFESLRGSGARALCNGQTLYVGNPKLFARLHKTRRQTAPAFPSVEDPDQQAALTHVVVGNEREIFGTMLLSDRARPEARDAIEQLRRFGIERLEMLTGDHQQIARRVAEELKLDAYHAELLPDEKLERVQQLTRRYRSVAMVGDGVNDAPALAAATVGVSMGKAGSDTALETADVTLMSDDLRHVADLVRLGRRTRRIIGQNIFLSLTIKLVFLLLVLAGPAVKLMWLAVAADMGASLLVIFNGMRLMAGGTHTG